MKKIMVIGRLPGALRLTDTAGVWAIHNRCLYLTNLKDVNVMLHKHVQVTGNTTNLFLICFPNRPQFEHAICRCLAAEEVAQPVRLTQPDCLEIPKTIELLANRQ